MEIRAYLEEFPKGAYVGEAIECLRNAPRGENGDGDDDQDQFADVRQPFEPKMVRVDGFSIGKYEVTQGHWKAIMNNNPSEFQKGNNFPVENVSWHDVQEYVEKLNARTGKQYRLPTGDEWEYACHGSGPDNSYCGGDDIDAVAWYSGNSDGSTHLVGQKQSNSLGIHDMSGNVSEWTSTRSDRIAAFRMLRGGSWNLKAQAVEGVMDGLLFDPRAGTHAIGFRLVHD